MLDPIRRSVQGDTLDDLRAAGPIESRVGHLAAQECDVFEARQQQARTATARAQTRPRRRCALRRTPGRSGIGDDSSSATPGTAWSSTNSSRLRVV